MELREKVHPRTIKKISEFLLQTSDFFSENANLYINDTVFFPEDRFPIPRHQKRDDYFERPTIVVFSDDAPLLNWAHKCKYLLFDADEAVHYETIEANFPPFFLIDKDEANFKPIHLPIKFPEYWTQNIKVKRKINSRVNYNRHALLYSGMSDARHVNDLEFMYRMLTGKYDFPPGNITVLNYDGTINYSNGTSKRWPGDNTKFKMQVHNSGTKYNFFSALNDISKKLTEPDLLLIHTNNHGFYNEDGSYICSFYETEEITATELGHELSKLPSITDLIVMMEQCYSGGFVKSVIANSTAKSTSISCACNENSSSIGGRDFDPFAMDWISAMNILNPYGHALKSNPDLDGDHKISSEEAFFYAKKHKDSYDTPVYDFKNNGNKTFL